MLEDIAVQFKFTNGLYVSMDLLHFYFNKNELQINHSGGANDNMSIDFDTEKVDIICIKSFLNIFCYDKLNFSDNATAFFDILYLLKDKHGKSCMDYAIEFGEQRAINSFLSTGL